MRIGLDLDDVLANGTEKFIEFHNRKHKTNLNFHNLFTYALSEILGIPEELAIKRVIEFDKSNFSKEISPLDGAKEIVKKLNENHDLVVITARPKKIEFTTTEWIKKNFPEIKSVFFISKDYFNKLKSKAEICLENSIDILIEDNLAHAFECSRNNIPVLLFDYPWNQVNEGLPENIQRIKSWKEVLKKINSKEEKK
ncbi:hypothetical protein KAJ87_02615 [Candidatus Pacearchaeota archaeon]|nr:hypothetical protein [Candidatus Pacearchaeota archaeon]